MRNQGPNLADETHLLITVALAALAALAVLAPVGFVVTRVLF